MHRSRNMNIRLPLSVSKIGRIDCARFALNCAVIYTFCFTTLREVKRRKYQSWAPSPLFLLLFLPWEFWFENKAETIGDAHFVLSCAANFKFSVEPLSSLLFLLVPWEFWLENRQKLSVVLILCWAVPQILSFLFIPSPSFKQDISGWAASNVAYLPPLPFRNSSQGWTESIVFVLCKIVLQFPYPPLWDTRIRN